ncbi:pyridoxamine 5'-phosphate oxidase family protein [Streptomyces olivoreticuli]|uniref:pyridoxamine 5'-phosphate oxidase family protein n=1 Tax=Streptomyces olivoreticuli TaxID=68246 RepID=UPI00265AC0B6|nr:pyridoxamine 5'-phosphate oxidase family protein [Streptomyces olivoreticuli]WKK20863.1 pyridoxamine 5'-phosphate oxidase family protein [Streptomyces olivoreticuli]
MLTAPTGPTDGHDEYRALELLGRMPYGRLSVSMRALPFVTVARHIVSGRSVILRMHAGFGYAQACDGNVVAYGADNLSNRHEGDEDVWNVQFVGTARLFTPSPADLELFGRPPRAADDAPFIPEYLCIEPQFITLHHLEGIPARQVAHSA